jgi:LemA protein
MLTDRRLRVGALLTAIAIVLAGCGVNTIPTLEEQAKGRWSDVQNQYQRRADLIPNLVETVKGYAKQEQDTLTRVVEARAKATSIKVDASTVTDPAKFKEFQDAQNQLSGALGRLIAISKFKEFQDAQNQLSGALGRLIAISENYPDLKSNQNFLALQSQLEGTENRIAVSRRDYVNAVQAYNTEVRTFPGLLWAKFWGAKPMETFTATPESQKAPQVKF